MTLPHLHVNPTKLWSVLRHVASLNIVRALFARLQQFTIIVYHIDSLTTIVFLSRFSKERYEPFIVKEVCILGLILKQSI